MAENDIRRKAELVIAGALKTVLPSWTFLAFRGGNEPGGTGEAKAPKAPFVVLEAMDDEKLVGRTWMIQLGVGYITELTDTLPADHSANLKILHDAIEAIRPGVDAQQNFILHGIDILSTHDFEDEAKRARGDVFVCALGCDG